MIGPNEIRRRMGYHRPSDLAQARLSGNRERVIDLAHFFDLNLPDGREKSLAMTTLQESLMWANAAIATNADA